MKATIDEKGVLRIAPETPLEAFALAQWTKLALLPASPGLSDRALFLGTNLTVSTEISQPLNEGN